MRVLSGHGADVSVMERGHGATPGAVLVDDGHPYRLERDGKPHRRYPATDDMSAMREAARFLDIKFPLCPQAFQMAGGTAIVCETREEPIFRIRAH